MNAPKCKCSRVLFLYYRLENGEVLNPFQFQHEFNISGRTFQRDIDELRCFYSDRGYEDGTYAFIIYDRTKQGYILKKA